MIDVVLLGTGGMMPLPTRWLSSLLMRANGDLTLFDCGEGTQIAWRVAGWSFRRLGAICISHTHSDHIAGLPGLLHTMANTGRIEPIDLFGPPGIADVVRGLRSIAPTLPYELHVTEVLGGAEFALPGGLVGTCVAGDHGLPVLAYRADLHRQPAFLPERARDLGIPVPLWNRLHNGRAVSWDGGSAEPADVLGPARRGLGIAYVTDTRPVPDLIRLAADVDLLVCEGTYGSDEDLPKAIRNQHMTFREAATMARDARVGQLWLTHFSPALEDPEAFAPLATGVFPASTVGHDGLDMRLAFSREEGLNFPPGAPG